MYIPGRLRTASRPLRTWIDSALYSGLPSSGGVLSLGHSLQSSGPGPVDADRDPADFLDPPRPARIEPGQDPGRHQTQLVGPRARSRRGPGAAPSRRDRLGGGDRRDLRADQLGPLLDDAGLLQPLGEARLLEVARERLGERAGRRASGSPDSPVPPSRSHTGRSASGGSSSRRGRGDEDLASIVAEDRASQPALALAIQLGEDIVEQQRRLGAARRRSDTSSTA